MNMLESDTYKIIAWIYFYGDIAIIIFIYYFI